MVRATRVVATTVGPYARYGSTLAEACARGGTDYADLTGEVLFVRDSLDRYGELAEASSAESSTRAGSTPSRQTLACSCWPSRPGRITPVLSRTPVWS